MSKGLRNTLIAVGAGVVLGAVAGNTTGTVQTVTGVAALVAFLVAGWFWARGKVF